MSDFHEVDVVLQGQMHFTSQAEDDITIHMDANPEVGGEGLGARPQALILVSLGGCSGMDVISILRKKRQDVTGLRINIRAERAEDHPKVYTHIWMNFIVTGRALDPAAVLRAIELSMTRYCPVANLLHKAVKIDTSFELVEA